MRPPGWAGASTSGSDGLTCSPAFFRPWWTQGHNQMGEGQPLQKFFALFLALTYAKDTSQRPQTLVGDLPTSACFCPLQTHLWGTGTPAESQPQGSLRSVLLIPSRTLQWATRLGWVGAERTGGRAQCTSKVQVLLSTLQAPSGSLPTSPWELADGYPQHYATHIHIRLSMPGSLWGPEGDK